MSVLRKTLFALSPVFLSACIEAEEKVVQPQAEEVKTTESAMASFDEAAIKTRFAAIGITVNSIEATAFDGVVEVSTSSGVVYSDKTGQNFIAGTLYSFDEEGNPVDILAAKQAPINAAKIESFADDMIVYQAENEKFAVTVFTDTTCTYCVRLHSQMQGYNDLGITVRYLAYPRQGPTGDVAQEMAKIWCSEDPAKAMGTAKIERNFNEEVQNLAQCQQKVADQYMLGRDLGISGTPAVFLPDGNVVAGYMPPAGLYKRLLQVN
ncbi:thioredoxin fold domain-containing protein [Vibrio sp. JC009]|uniref:thioredoxin fold domain-containing protein n=1 Tax=Vibrio sp. JC009 TaxID=2912314 RepID=UPI0023B17A79|nr:thioredoxin fold domain-containing protein [Vibrio sp. JC009]WED21386.1 thioredoxin fold domain-containing protein [Vibrio sp. JC009]